ATADLVGSAGRPGESAPLAPLQIAALLWTDGTADQRRLPERERLHEAAGAGLGHDDIAARHQPRHLGHEAIDLDVLAKAPVLEAFEELRVVSGHDLDAERTLDLLDPPQYRLDPAGAGAAAHQQDPRCDRQRLRPVGGLGGEPSEVRMDREA